MTKTARTLYVSLALLAAPVLSSLSLRAGESAGACCSSSTGCSLSAVKQAKSACCATKSSQVVMIKVSGGDCGALGDKLSKVKGVQGVETCSTTHFTKVAYNPEEVRASRVLSAVKRAGYNVELQRVTLAVNGMSCGECTGKVSKALTALKGVSNAHVCPESKQAVVDFDPNKVSAKRVLATVDRTGFKATEVLN